MFLQSGSPSPWRLRDPFVQHPLRPQCPRRFRPRLLAPLKTPAISIAGANGSTLSRRLRKLTIASCGSETDLCMEPSDPQDSVSKGSLSNARAYWVCKSHIAWDVNVNTSSVYLYSSKIGKLSVLNGDIMGYDEKVKLEQDMCGLPANATRKFPHIQNYYAFRIPNDVDVPKLLKGQLGVVCFDDYGRYITATGIQLPGVLDELFSYSGHLGAIFGEEAISLHLWAPTAHGVRAYLYNDEFTQDPSECIELEEERGVWHATLPRNREGHYYMYEVSAFHQCTLNVESCTVNDPYARGISSDGRRTLLVNLDSDSLKPSGWASLSDEKPGIQSFSDISIYELHIRDFSAMDYTMNPEHRGGYLAFSCEHSAGVDHLRKLSNAGLTHVHLLPSFHFAGVDDDKGKWKHVDEQKLSMLPPDSDEQQAEISAIKDQDSYNWGYNPVLWSVPKGSYASNPSGTHRIHEFRKMVQALNRIGLRVVLDVVYNHVSASGPHDEFSVLEKIVPGYYLRRNADGYIEHSTCINNTASEHFMVERLIIDDLLSWAVDYKVDGFRFDLMGHIMKSTMVKAKSALQDLSKDKDGVDGSKIYLYGEGWDFGEVSKNGRGINASQFNISGTGIGSFNDRIRDSVLGGSPFGHPLQQGFVTGLSLQPNDHDHGDKLTTDSMLSASLDHILAGLAGNIKDFVFTSHLGNAVKGSEVLTHDRTPVSYASCPTETINYVSAHDNETLFDIISLKTPEQLPLADRCRINHLATSLVALSQGIPFFHAGDEILRSKSLDRDSYNSGDWFNKLDFTYESNNWGVGLPPKEKNEKNWPLMKPRLGNPAFKPEKECILSALENFTDLLRIRYSSPLFRLKTANDIQERLRFHNTGPSWIPGVILMSIEDGHKDHPGMTQLDPNYSFIVVIFNASPMRVSFSIPSLQKRSLQLHPVQLASADELTKTSSYEHSSGSFAVPAHTTAVFVEVRDF